MVRIIYPGPINSFHEEESIYRFLKALDEGDDENNLAMKIRDREPSTLDEALQLAIKMENNPFRAEVKEIKAGFNGASAGLEQNPFRANERST